MKAKTYLFTSLLLFTALACEAPEAEQPEPPAPIGEELLSFTASISALACVEGHLYRARDQAQLHCYAADGSFAYENRGTLKPEAEAALTQALASADPEDTTLVDPMGVCDAPDAQAGSITLWVGEASVSYAPGCPTQGILELDELGTTLLGDLTDCTELDLLASVESGCRAY